jgi:hypothetical protein
MKNSGSTFHGLDYLNALGDPQIPPEAKTQVRRNMSWRVFMETVHTIMKTSASMFHAPDAPECIR